jgi:hypothetical protein
MFRSAARLPHHPLILVALRAGCTLCAEGPWRRCVIEEDTANARSNVSLDPKADTGVPMLQQVYVERLRCWERKGLDTSTQGEYTNSKPAFENIKDFNGSERQSQILPLRPETIQQSQLFIADRRWLCSGSVAAVCRYRGRSGDVNAAADARSVANTSASLSLIPASYRMRNVRAYKSRCCFVRLSLCTTGTSIPIPTRLVRYRNLAHLEVAA